MSLWFLLVIVFVIMMQTKSHIKNGPKKSVKLFHFNRSSGFNVVMVVYVYMYGGTEKCSFAHKKVYMSYLSTSV